MPHPIEHHRRKDLDREISSYISVLRKKEKKGVLGFLKSLKGRKKGREVEMHPEVEAYGGEKPKHHKIEEECASEEAEGTIKVRENNQSFWAKLKSILVFEKEPYENLEEVEEPMPEPENEEAEVSKPESEIEEEYAEEVQKQGLFSRIMDKILVKSREEEELDEADDEIAEDLQDIKAIAEITTSVMKMLPKDKLKELKDSEDFRRFKEILKKRNLIK